MAKTAQVVSIDTNAMAGNFPVTKLTLNQDGKEKTHTVFKKSPIINQVNQLQPGDWVEYGLKQNGQYFNLDTIRKVDKPVGTPVSTPSSGFREDPTKQLEIRRAVALKAAVDITSSVIKKLDEIRTDDICLLAHKFEVYLEKGFPIEEKAAATLDD